MPEKLTVRLDDDLVKWIDEMIKKKVFRDRTHAIAYCVLYTKEHRKEKD